LKAPPRHPSSERSSSEEPVDRLPWGPIARAIVRLRFLILPAWIAGAVIATIHLPSIFDAESGELGSLLPQSSKALEVERKAVKTFGAPLLSRTMVVAHEPGGFPADRLARASRYILATDRQEGPEAIRAVPLTNARGLLSSQQTATTLVTYLYIDPSLGESESQLRADRFASGLKGATGAEAVEVTGALPATRAETDIANRDILWVELVTMVLVVGILAFYFRAIGVPLLALGAVAIAYLVADRVLGWIAERYGLSIPREAEPVIVALIFGTLTDYLVFFVSGFRQRLRQGVAPRDAATAVTGELLPVILTAAAIIACSTLTLLISGVRFLSAFGPSMAVAVVVAAAVAVTLIPASLAIFGRAVFWPRSQRERRRRPDDEPDAGLGARRHAIGAAVRFPLAVAGLCLLLLAAAATGLRHLELGNPIIRGLPEATSARPGSDIAATDIGPGVLGPTMVVLEGGAVAAGRQRLAEFQSRLSAQAGVAGVLGPADQPLRDPGVFLAPSGDAARFALVLDGDPDGAAASKALSGLEERVPALAARSGLGGVRVGVTGDTAIASELTEDTWSALERVAPAALAVLLLLLWVLLRSWRAALYLTAVSVLVVAAALGLTVYVFQDLLGYGELAFFVPVASAILLLALGADYNVFLVSRIWWEAERKELRPAIRTAGSRAARAITVAGIILALSFAAVALIPIQSFREFAFAMSVGLLLDTLIARTLLIPALVSLLGRGTARESGEVSAA
jgi:putative drug exporter of the RND superfamily